MLRADHDQYDQRLDVPEQRLDDRKNSPASALSSSTGRSFQISRRDQHSGRDEPANPVGQQMRIRSDIGFKPRRFGPRRRRSTAIRASPQGPCSRLTAYPCFPLQFSAPHLLQRQQRPGFCRLASALQPGVQDHGHHEGLVRFQKAVQRHDGSSLSPVAQLVRHKSRPSRSTPSSRCRTRPEDPRASHGPSDRRRTHWSDRFASGEHRSSGRRFLPVAGRTFVAVARLQPHLTCRPHRHRRKIRQASEARPMLMHFLLVQLDDELSQPPSSFL